jgi:hypothetical protein
MSDEQNLGEQALGKIAEIAITSQLDETKDVNVDISTDPVKLIQGKVDTVSITGEGMVMKQDLRVEALGMRIDSVSIDPVKAIVGEIELTQPANAQVQVLLTEEDINRALNSEYLRNKMQNLTIEAQDQPVLFDIQQVRLRLPRASEMDLDVSLVLRPENEIKQFSATARPFLADDGQRIALEILNAEGQGLTLEFVTLLMEKIIELLDLRNFELNGSSVWLKDFDIQAGKVLIRGASVLNQFNSKQ